MVLRALLFQQTRNSLAHDGHWLANLSHCCLHNTILYVKIILGSGFMTKVSLKKAAPIFPFPEKAALESVSKGPAIGSAGADCLPERAVEGIYEPVSKDPDVRSAGADWLPERAFGQPQAGRAPFPGTGRHWRNKPHVLFTQPRILREDASSKDLLRQPHKTNANFFPAQKRPPYSLPTHPHLLQLRRSMQEVCRDPEHRPAFRITAPQLLHVRHVPVLGKIGVL